MQRSGAVGAILLAAGGSSRMGRHKLLLPLGERPIVAHVAQAAVDAHLSPLVVVLGRDASTVSDVLSGLPHVEALNPDYEKGMAGSLRIGMDRLRAIPESDYLIGAMVLLGDQPLLTGTMLSTLADAARQRPSSIVAASYAGQRGNPVYFPRHLWDEFAGLTGDEGARSILARHADGLVTVALAPTEAALDVDAPDDYARVLVYWQANRT